MTQLSNLTSSQNTNSSVLSKIKDSFQLLQETYQEIGLPEEELLHSESYLIGKINELIQQADLTKQTLNLDIMTIMNNITEIDSLLHKNFKYDNVIGESIKSTIDKIHQRFQHSISNDEISQILLQLNTSSPNLLDLKEKMLKTFNQLHPRFTNKVIDLSNKTLKFYDYYNKIDGYNLKNTSLLQRLPTVEEATTYNQEGLFDFENVDYIINNTIYKDMSHSLFAELDQEIVLLKSTLKEKIDKLFEISKEIALLYNDLSIQELNSKVLYLNELQKGEKLDLDKLVELVHHNIGLKTKNIEELKELKQELSDEKESREIKLTRLRSDCQQLWFRLNQDTPYINEFLKNNNNLRYESLQNFEHEMERLKELKLQNIANFMEESRSKIRLSWDFLMYSDLERQESFPLYFNNDESEYSENFLDLHNDYHDKICNEVEELKPIFDTIKVFENLLIEKQELEESCKDASRLLQRNSFRILKEEERTRTRLSKLLPQTIQELKLALLSYETAHKKPLLIEGKIYYDELLNIEGSLNTKPSTKRRQQNQQRSLSINNKSAPSTTVRRPTSPSPSFVQSRSVSRKPLTPTDETPVRRGLNNTNGSSLRLNKASLSTIDDLNTKRRPQTPQALSPLYPPIERKRTLSPSRAMITKIRDEPPFKKTSALKSPLRGIGIPLPQPVLNRSNIIPSLKYNNTQSYVKSPVQLSSSEISMEDIHNADKENNGRLG